MGDDVDSMKLREATRDDAVALGALHVASWRETYAGILPDATLAALSVEERAAMWEQILSDPQAFGEAAVFIAEDGGRAVGFGACGRQRDEALAEAGFGGEIGAVYVLRACQGRGVGRAIMAAMAQALTASSHKGASLWVLRENRAARAFYEGLGGKILGERVDAQPEASLVEIGYGWRDLSRLAG